MQVYGGDLLAVSKNSRRQREALAKEHGQGEAVSKFAAKRHLQAVANRGTFGEVLAEALAKKETGK